jgi:transposase-like protein
MFSEELRKEVVKEIERGEMTVLQASREHGVSTKSIYQWLRRYSRYLKGEKRIVVEKESESKRREELQKQNAELERIIGQKQLEIDFLNRLIEKANEEYKVDIKKNFGTK